jgi:hypothetical protein
MKKAAYLAVALVAGTGISHASADIIVGNNGATWKSFPGTLNDYSNFNRPYWDQKSEDGVNKNIGNYLQGTLGITPAWWGDSGGYTSNFNLNYHFTHDTSAGATTGALKIEIAGNAGTNVVGWYNVDNPSEKHVLWNGSASPSNNASVVFTPTDNYGFYIVGAEGTYYMDSSLNGGSEKYYQHFATFATDLTPGRTRSSRASPGWAGPGG